MDNQDTKETLKVQKTHLVLLSDKHYYNYVFKKTERIACVVFYILHNHRDIKGQQEKYVLDITDTAQRTLDLILRTLSFEPQEATPLMMRGVAYMVRLQSYLQLGRSMGVFNQDTVDVLNTEIEGVMRSINRYLDDGVGGAFDFTVEKASPVFSKGVRMPRESAQIQSGGYTSERSPGAAKRMTQSHQSRQGQIRDIIAVKKTVSIKDLSEEIKDCSEKTIQRELNDMINKGIIKREGERRWSRYSLI